MCLIYIIIYLNIYKIEYIIKIYCRYIFKWIRFTELCKLTRYINYVYMYIKYIFLYIFLNISEIEISNYIIITLI